MSDNNKKPWAVWIDDTYGYAYGPTDKAELEQKTIVSYCDTFDEARITWKFYYYK